MKAQTDGPTIKPTTSQRILKRDYSISRHGWKVPVFAREDMKIVRRKCLYLQEATEQRRCLFDEPAGAAIKRLLPFRPRRFGLAPSKRLPAGSQRQQTDCWVACTLAASKASSGSVALVPAGADGPEISPSTQAHRVRRKYKRRFV